jgi:hypothetical protein
MDGCIATNNLYFTLSKPNCERLNDKSAEKVKRPQNGIMKNRTAPTLENPLVHQSPNA